MSIIRVMTFNVNGVTYTGPGATPEALANSWQHRATLNVATIRRYAPDLIGFQEVQAANLATYQDALGDYDHVPGNLYGDVEPTERTSIFWRSARFDLVASGEFWLSRTPDQPSIDWDVPYPMGVTWVKLRRRDDGVQLLHLNTHLDDESAQSRLEASKLIVERIAQLQGGQIPAIITGDFNCNPWHPPYRGFMDQGYSDTYRAAGHADSTAASTFHGLHGDAYFALEWGEELFWRVDWILTRDGAQRLQVTSSVIVRDAQPPIYPSDHYPVVSELRLLD